MKESLIDNVEKWKIETPTAIAIKSTEKFVTYSELYNYIVNAQKALNDIGLVRGDSVIYAGSKNKNLIILHLALFGLGISVLTVKGSVQMDSLMHVVDQCSSKFIICDGNFEIINEETLTFYGKNEHIMVLRVNEKKITKIAEFQLDNKDFSRKITNVKGDKVYLNSTSGTTNIVKIVNVEEYKIIENARSINSIFPLEVEDSYLCLLPEYMHPHEIFCRPLVAGATIALLETKSFYKLGLYLNKFGVTQIFGIPSQFLALLEMPLTEMDFKTVKYLFAGGEKTSYYLKNEFYKRYNRKIIPFWGSTETSGSTFYDNSSAINSVDGLIGRPFPGYDVKINENSELCIKGKACFEGYLHKDTSSNIDYLGYYNTQDRVCLDIDGRYKFLGRKDQVFKVNGLRVSLEDVNAYLAKCTVIKQFFVCVPEDNRGHNLIFIYIVPTESTKIPCIKEYVRRYFSSNIKYRISFIDKTPLTDFGKMDLAKLEDQANKEVKTIWVLTKRYQ